MNLTADIGPSLAVVALYALLFGAVELWSRVCAPQRELTRKAVHCGGGLIALGFPAWFGSAASVAVLAVLFVAALLLARRTDLLRSVQAVERITFGELLFPVALATVMAASSWCGDYGGYTIAVLVLAVADAAAGLVGTRFGRRVYHVLGGKKSLEGSATFFAVAFTIVALCLAVDGLPIGSALAVALFVALPVTGMEAVAPNGFDNITVAFGTWALVMLAGEIAPSVLLLHACGAALAGSFLLWLALRRQVFAVGTAIVTALLLYAVLVAVQIT